MRTPEATETRPGYGLVPRKVDFWVMKRSGCHLVSLISHSAMSLCKFSLVLNEHALEVDGMPAECLCKKPLVLIIASRP